MSKLILIKHSLPTIDPTAPAATWQLAPEGLRRCAALAAALAGYLPAVLLSSPEPKAQATAAYLAAQLALPLTVVDGLEEQHRRSAPFSSDAVFRQTMQTFFAQPAALVFGEESADAAYARFAAALDQQLAAHPHDNLLVVTHGTVMSLYLSRRTQCEPFALWERLGLPSFVVLDRATATIAAAEWQVPRHD